MCADMVTVLKWSISHCANVSRDTLVTSVMLKLITVQIIHAIMARAVVWQMIFYANVSLATLVADVICDRVTIRLAIRMLNALIWLYLKQRIEVTAVFAQKDFKVVRVSKLSLRVNQIHAKMVNAYHMLYVHR